MYNRSQQNAIWVVADDTDPTLYHTGKIPSKIEHWGKTPSNQKVANPIIVSKHGSVHKITYATPVFTTLLTSPKCGWIRGGSDTFD